VTEAENQKIQSQYNKPAYPVMGRK